MVYHKLVVNMCPGIDLIIQFSSLRADLDGMSFAYDCRMQLL